MSEASQGVEPDLSFAPAFVDAIFRYASPDTFFALRVFKHQHDQPPPWMVDVRFGDTDRLLAEIERGIHYAATTTDPTVFSPAMCAMARPGTAKGRDIAEGVALIVELDEGDTAAALARLEALIGPATVVVLSGGEWLDPTTGELHRKRHAYWRLSEATRDEPDHVLLYAARRDAALLCGADPTGKPLVHCYRMPGSLHRKNPDHPTLCVTERINPGAEIHLVDAADTLTEAVEGAALYGDRKSGSAKGNGNGASLGKRELQADPTLVAAAMACIPNPDVHYADWVRMAYAVAGATGGTGYSLFHAWSAQSFKHDDGETEALWSRVSPTKIGAGTIFHEAKLHGWIDPRQKKREKEKTAQDGPTAGLGTSQTPPIEPGTGGGGGGTGGTPPLLPGGPSDGGSEDVGPDDDGEDAPGPGWIEGPEELDDAARPTITVVKGMLHRLASDAEAAIIASGLPVYHRGPRLVRPAITELAAADGGLTHIAALHTLTVPGLDDLFCRTARWRKWNETAKRNVPTDPPERVAKVLLAREGQWHLPQLRGILSVPTLRPDGSRWTSTATTDKAATICRCRPDCTSPPSAPNRPGPRDWLHWRCSTRCWMNFRSWTAHRARSRCRC